MTGFDEHMLTKPTCDLSGGWAMRAALGAALFVKPNLLLLGERVGERGRGKQIRRDEIFIGSWWYLITNDFKE